MNRLKINQKEEEEDKIVSLDVIQGGKGPPTTGSDWLSELDVGTIFFVQSKNGMDFNLGLFMLEMKEGRVVALRTPQFPKAIYVNPTRFCNQYMLYHNCGIVERKEFQDDEDHRDAVEPGPSSDPVA